MADRRAVRRCGEETEEIRKKAEEENVERADAGHKRIDEDDLLHRSARQAIY
jgi:hypothetical protein